MEILHVIPVNGSHIIPLAETLQRYDKENTHNFVVTTVFQTVLNKNMDLLRIRGLQYMPHFHKQKFFRKILHLRRLAKKADRIVWHTLQTNGGYTPFFLFAFPGIRKKSTWIPAEGEIGNSMSVSNRFLNRFSGFVSGYVQRHMGCIGIRFPSDRKVLEEFAITRPQVAVLPYAGNAAQLQTLNRSIREDNTVTPKKKIFVQVGLSSQRHNQHNAAFDCLQELPDAADACVFVPLRYVLEKTAYSRGARAYIAKTRSAAAKLSCKTIFLDKAPPVEDYLKFLKQIDIVILRNHESCQMGMLLCLLALGKRVFMDQESPLYRYLSELGAGVHPVESLAEAGSLAAVLELPGATLPRELQTYFDTDRALAQWMQWSRSENN